MVTAGAAASSATPEFMDGRESPAMTVWIEVQRLYEKPTRTVRGAEKLVTPSAVWPTSISASARLSTAR